MPSLFGIRESDSVSQMHMCGACVGGKCCRNGQIWLFLFYI